MAEETTKIYTSAKEDIQDHYNNNTSLDLLGAYIAKDISLAVAEVYGKGNKAEYLLNVISNKVQAWCNPVLNDEDD
jgi:hypothetical protein